MVTDIEFLGNFKKGNSNCGDWSVNWTAGNDVQSYFDVYRPPYPKLSETFLSVSEIFSFWICDSFDCGYGAP